MTKLIGGVFFLISLGWFAISIPRIDRTEREEVIKINGAEHKFSVVEYLDSRDPLLWHCFVIRREDGGLIRYQAFKPNAKPEVHRLPTGSTAVVNGHWAPPLILVGDLKHRGRKVEIGSEESVILYSRLEEVKNAYSEQNFFMNRRLNTH